MTDERGAIFGQACVERGWVTREQLVDCLKECDGQPDLAAALSRALVSRGWVTDVQASELRQDVERVLRSGTKFSVVRKEDATLGHLIVTSGVATKEQVLEALSIQQFAAKKGGAVPRLGEILIQKGYATFAQLDTALRRQKLQTTLLCPGCQEPVVVLDFDPKKTYLCRRCTSPLTPPQAAQADTPEDVVRAGLNPKNVLGKYVVVREVGRGGMGAVYKAWDNALKRWVALKVLMNAGSDDDLVRFRREAEACAALQHPNIVSVFEVTQAGDRHCIAMEYIVGRTLAGQKRPYREACEIMVQVARAVDHAHQKGIIHRDLKPANVMIDANGKARVMDFGLAKSMRGASSVTMEGTVVGTPSYMAPEQAAGNISQIDQRSDVYSLGAVLYELLTGHPPFKANSAIETLSQVVHRPVSPPSRSEPGVPPEVDAIVLRAMEKDKAKRYALARAMAHDLEGVLAGRRAARRPPSLSRNLARQVRRPTPAALIVAVVVGVAGLLALLAFLAR